ncbi:MAG: hypothetical protein IK990_11205 [Ruminiclostridium sp.]|nr:hypothetical protein [Ruminiclostridium sp.]
MSDMSLFYSSMSNVLNQWSDFRVAKPLYKHYFAQQKAEAKSTAEEAASKYKKTETTSKSTAYSAASNDKLKTYSDNVKTAVTNLESAFKEDSATGEVDTDKAFAAAEKFVDSYNQLYSSTKSSGNASVSGKSQFVANMTNAYSIKLAKVGISVGTDGKLSIDKDTFSSATDEERSEIFGKKNSYASFMSEQANAVSAYAQTAAYLDANKTYTSSGTVASSNSTALSGVLYNQLF